MREKITSLGVSNSRFGHSQYCEIILSNNKKVLVENDEIYDLTGIEPFELEVLAGSEVILAENSDSLKIEEYLLSVTRLKLLRDCGLNYIDGFERINDVRYESGLNTVRVLLETDNDLYNINYIPLSIMTCLREGLFSSLIDCFINPEYFKVGEMMGNIPCKSSNKTIKELNLRYCYHYAGKIQTMRVNGNFDTVPNKINYKNHSRQNDFSINDRIDSEEKHGGPRDGYGGSLDDDFIDDALGGEPDAYWNID